MVHIEKTGLLLVLALLCAPVSNAFKLDGKIITNEGDTIIARIMVNTSPVSKDPDYHEMQYKVKYRGPDDEELQEITPGQAKEVQLIVGTKLVRLISCHVVKTSGTDTRAFLRMKVKGRYNLYIYYDWHSTLTYNGDDLNKSMAVMGFWTIQKEGGYAIVLPKSWEYENELKGYFENCPEIQKKIDPGRLRKWRIAKVIQQYNDDCI